MQDATAVTYGDRKSARSKPPPLPTEFWSFLHMLGNHIKIVGTVTNTRETHSREVMEIRRILESQCAEKEAYTPEMFAHIFWHILMDSRQYFNTFVTVPVSNLGVLRESIRSFVVRALRNCPVHELIGKPKRSREEQGMMVEEICAPWRKLEGGGGNGENGSGGKKPNWMSVLPPMGKLCQERSPNCQIEDLFNKFPSLNMKDFRIDRVGTCQDYHLFGECKRFNCRFFHKDTNMPEERKQAAVSALKASTGSLK